jgi:hypothetical protein
VAPAPAAPIVGRQRAIAIPVEALHHCAEALVELRLADQRIAVRVKELEGAHRSRPRDLRPHRVELLHRQVAVGVGVRRREPRCERGVDFVLRQRAILVGIDRGDHFADHRHHSHPAVPAEPVAGIAGTRDRCRGKRRQGAAGEDCSAIEVHELRLRPLVANERKLTPPCRRMIPAGAAFVALRAGQRDCDSLLHIFQACRSASV